MVALCYMSEHCFRLQAATMEGGQLKVKPLSVLKEGSYNCPEERLESLEQKFQEILSFLVKLDIRGTSCDAVTKLEDLVDSCTLCD